jgi:hypothetical protein
VEYDTEMDTARCFHMEIAFFAANGWDVSPFLCAGMRALTNP